LCSPLFNFLAISAKERKQFLHFISMSPVASLGIELGAMPITPGRGLMGDAATSFVMMAVSWLRV
jgi:hypothetical protein